MVTNSRTNNQPGEPRASLLLTNEKAVTVFCKKCENQPLPKQLHLLLQAPNLDWSSKTSEPFRQT